jgi:hypothetical protein
MISLSWGQIAILSSAGRAMLSTVSFVEKGSQQSLGDRITALENVLEAICIAPKYRSNRTILIGQLDMYKDNGLK